MESKSWAVSLNESDPDPNGLTARITEEVPGRER